MTEARMQQGMLVAVKIAISAALLALVLSEARTVGFAAINSALSPTTIATVIGIALLQMAVVSAWRLKLVMQLLGCQISAVNAALITWSGFFVEQVGGVFVAGDAARIWLLRRTNLGLITATEGPLLDRVLGLVTIVAMASLGMPRLWWNFSDGQRRGLLLSVGVAAMALTALAALAMLVVNQNLRVASWIERLRDLATSTLKLSVRSSRSRIAAVVLLAFATHCLNVIAIYLLLGTIGVNLDLVTCFAFTPTVLLVSMLPVSFSGWGVREAALILVLKNFGVSSAHALTASVLFGICVLIASLPGAVVWLLIPDRRNSFLLDRFQGPTPISRRIKLPR